MPGAHSTSSTPISGILSSRIWKADGVSDSAGEAQAAPKLLRGKELFMETAPLFVMAQNLLALQEEGGG